MTAAPLSPTPPEALEGLPDDAAALVRAIVEAGTAEATRRAYARDWKYFSAWRSARGLGEEVPVPPAVVITFVTDHLGGMPADVDEDLVASGLKARPGPHKLSTIRRRLASISALHQTAGFVSPSTLPDVRQLLRKAAKAVSAAGERTTRKRAATRDILERMVATCGPDLLGRRDRALLLVGASSGGRRRSELAALDLSDLEPCPGGWTYRLRRSKTDPEGTDERAYPILGIAAEALAAWLEATGLEVGQEGPVFRGVDRHRNLLPGGITGRTVSESVKRRAERAGLDPKEFAGHSLRSGFVTEAGRAGIVLRQAMDLSGHRSERIAGNYHQAGAVTVNPAGRLFG